MGVTKPPDDSGGTTTPPVSNPNEGMVLIPAGEFRMGSNDAETRSDEKDEIPIHSVYIDAFYMDKYEVTNAEYREFVLANPGWQKSRINGQFHNGDYLKHWNGNDYPIGKANHPVTYVSWYSAMAYAKWKGKRLPTEAEWEKAARGGLSGLKYPWGNTIDSTKANYNRHIGDTTAVGKYTANGYGLYDMAGNVGEYCLDEYNPGFYALSPSQNPLSGANSVKWVLDNYIGINSFRVLRGGSWLSTARYMRVAGRSPTTPSFARSYNGFRCVRAVSP